MINAIQLLKMEAHARREMSTPNANTITVHAAANNAELAEEFDLAAEALRRMHNKTFEEGILAGVESLKESCKVRRERKDKCPRCGGEADNGHDRCVPPNPYYCKKCQDEVDTENVKRWNEGKNNGE